MNDHREIPIRASNTGISNYGSNNNNPYVQISPVPTSPEAKNRPNPMDTVHGAINDCSRKVGEATKQAETIADNFWNHIRVSFNLAGTTMGRIVQGTKVLQKEGLISYFNRFLGIFQERSS